MGDRGSARVRDDERDEDGESENRRERTDTGKGVTKSVRG